MAGKQIALLRLLRLMGPLQATVTSKEFKDLNVFQSVANLLLNPDFFKYLFVMCRCLYAPMRVLRLADQKTAAMDKLCYFVRQANRMMPRLLAEAEAKADILLTDTTRQVLEATTDKASMATLSSDEEDGSEDDDDNSVGEEEESDDDSSSDDSTSAKSAWTGDSLTHKVMRHWEKRIPALSHDYSRVGRMLSPSPTIMDDVIKSKTIEDEQAAERLIEKLILNPNLVGTERTEELSRLVVAFYSELEDFQNRTGYYNRDIIWVAADKVDLKAHEWHKVFSASTTEVLGKL